MKPYVLSLLHPEDVRIWREVSACVNALPDDIPSLRAGEMITLSCHVLARAVANVFSLRVVDGWYYSPGYEHSWVVTWHGNIIDVYPIATMGGPLLLSGDQYSAPARRLYNQLQGKELKRSYGQRFEEREFLRAVSIVTSQLRKIREDCITQRKRIFREVCEESRSLQ